MAENDSKAKGLNVELGEVKISATAQVLHKPGVERLDAYPHLVYAPAQHGPGIRTEDNGTPVADICNAFAVQPDTEAVARQFGTTAEHVNDALRYAAKVGYVEPDAG